MHSTGNWNSPVSSSWWSLQELSSRVLFERWGEEVQIRLFVCMRKRTPIVPQSSSMLLQLLLSTFCPTQGRARNCGADWWLNRSSSHFLSSNVQLEISLFQIYQLRLWMQFKATFASSLTMLLTSELLHQQTFGCVCWQCCGCGYGWFV